MGPSQRPLTTDFDRNHDLITCCSITLTPKSHRMISMSANLRFEGTRRDAS
jgi:hypothetical protein